MNNKTDIQSPTLDRNCGICAWSTRDTTNLIIKCCLGKNINNTWTTAHDCKQYADISKIKKTKKHVSFKQLDLFIHQNL